MIETGISRLDELMNGGIKKGSNILLIGPPMSGKEIILNHIIYHGASKNESAVIAVNTHESGTRILEWFDENNLTLPYSRIGIVDCTTRMIGGRADEDETIKIADGPVDLTLIGIKISQLLDKFFKIKNIQNIQLNINSLSTLLMYSKIKTVFKFLHVFTGRIRAMGGLGIYVLESGVHDMPAAGPLYQLFDGIMEVKSENDRNFIRVIGLSHKSTPWLEYEIEGANVIIG